MCLEWGLVVNDGKGSLDIDSEFARGGLVGLFAHGPVMKASAVGVYGAHFIDKSLAVEQRIIVGDQFSNNCVPTLQHFVFLNSEGDTDRMRMELICSESSAVDLDDGEKDLQAFALTLPTNVFLICSPDKACMKVAAKIGMLNRLVSLQTLANRVGRGNLKFRRNYTEQWHRQQCSFIQTEII